MKTTFIFLFVLTGISLSVAAQRFEHFKVDSTTRGWTISSAIDDTPDFQVAEKANPGWAFGKSHIINEIGKKALQTLPENIKKELVDLSVFVHFTLNANGDVYNIRFRGDMQSGIPLTDEQWLKVFDTMRWMKFDIAPLIPSGESRWRVSWTFPVSKWLCICCSKKCD